MSKLHKDRNMLSSFVKQVNALNFNNPKDLIKIKSLLNNMYVELDRLKNKQNNAINSSLHAKIEAEKDILMSLLFILQEKSIEYISKMT